MESLRIGMGGWVQANFPKIDGTIYLLFTKSLNGRLRVSEVHATNWKTPLAEVLRAIPLGRIEAFANSPEVSGVIRERIAEFGSAVDESFSDLWERVIPPTREEFAAENEALGMDMGPGRWFGYLPPRDFSTFSVIEPRKDELKLDVPTDRKKPNTFYAEVAATFSRAASASKRPALLLADANGVPVSTIHRWVKEARRRGLLAARTSSPTETQELPQGPEQ